MEVTAEVLGVVRRYLAGTATMADLQDVAARHVDALTFLPSYTTAYRLLGAIELGLAEFDAGDITEDELRRSLQEELGGAAIVIELSPSAAISLTTACTTAAHVELTTIGASGPSVQSSANLAQILTGEVGSSENRTRSTSCSSSRPGNSVSSTWARSPTGRS